MNDRFFFLTNVETKLGAFSFSKVWTLLWFLGEAGEPSQTPRKPEHLEDAHIWNMCLPHSWVLESVLFPVVSHLSSQSWSTDEDIFVTKRCDVPAAPLWPQGWHNWRREMTTRLPECVRSCAHKWLSLFTLMSEKTKDRGSGLYVGGECPSSPAVRHTHARFVASSGYSLFNQSCSGAATTCEDSLRTGMTSAVRHTVFIFAVWLQVRRPKCANCSLL